MPIDQAAVERLFDESRDPRERVRRDDWYPGPPDTAELDAVDTVEARRRWFVNLKTMGRL